VTGVERLDRRARKRFLTLAVLMKPLDLWSGNAIKLDDNSTTKALFGVPPLLPELGGGTWV